MNLLYALESVRTPFWDAVFSAVTHLGEETVFMVAAILIFWCVSKQEGYYLLLMGFFGTVVNQFLKLLFRIPRLMALSLLCLSICRKAPSCAGRKSTVQ